MNLKYIRIDNELTLKDVADILNVSTSAYGAWEKETTMIPLKRLIDFCDYFQVSVDYALGFTNIAEYPNLKKGICYELSNKRIKITRKLNNYSQDGIAKILGTNNSVISRYENGKTLILTTFLIEYATRFNISTDYLLGRIDEKLPIKKERVNAI